MKTRVITAVIALILFVPFVVIGGTPLAIVMGILSMVAMGEILYMKNRKLVSVEALLSFLLVLFLTLPKDFREEYLPGINPVIFVYVIALGLLITTVFTRTKFNFDSAGALVLAGIYIGFGFHYFTELRNSNVYLIILGLIVVWVTDSFAYILGKAFGKHKMIPKVSPNKTWEGSFGGSLVGTIFGVAFVLLFKNQFPDTNIFLLILLIFLLTVLGQIGDLIESAFKRYYGVKDSGKILPGHGGILDRFDSLLVVMPIIFFLFEELQ
ncbi:MAG: phosphatidate cytidylyltransferase [Lactobacillaceae bacterium]|jgi:phosphatidate cytidylyltransferase|nr:phosphatidate cytidylyltransferase [Lactobacillaceae bacterium]